MDPGVAEKLRLARAAAARDAIRKAGLDRPGDLTAPPKAWQRRLADAVDSMLRIEWPDSATSPDGVGPLLLTSSASGYTADAILHLVPGGTRAVRLEFDSTGECVVHVAVADETSPATSRLDPRRPMRWAFSVSTSDDDGPAT